MQNSQPALALAVLRGGCKGVPEVTVQQEGWRGIPGKHDLVTYVQASSAKEADKASKIKGPQST